MNRRTFAREASGIFLGSALGITSRRADDGNATARVARIEAVLFDAFPIFDPRSIARVAEDMFPGRGSELMSVWLARQFEYQWLRVVAGNYADFWRCTQDALDYAASALELELTRARHDRLMNAYLALRTWPDVLPALEQLRAAGVRLAFLSNFTTPMLEAAIRSAGLTGFFEHILSTDRVRTYKPDARAYQLGVDTLGLARDQMIFAAFAGWDASGATRFGYPTFWVNRLHAVPEHLGAPAPDGTGTTLTELVAFVRAFR